MLIDLMKRLSSPWLSFFTIPFEYLRWVLATLLRLLLKILSACPDFLPKLETYARVSIEKHQKTGFGDNRRETQFGAILCE
ncbi:MAG: hypothetical protein ACPGQS_06635 [Bradymonadia bacterium]